MADYVIVGAGSAGCVLAERLSTRHSVVLVEAGGHDRTLEVAIPAAFPKLFNGQRDWAYSTGPEPGADGRSLFLPRGKMIGGSSSMNAGIYVRGRPSDYAGWVSSGADGWDWSPVLEVFKRMESNSRGASEYHGDKGEVVVEDLRSPNPLSRRFVDAALALGIPANNDFNGATQDGVGFFQVTQRRGRRWSAADAFLRPAMGRPTLEVIPGALASRVVLEAGRAVALEYMRNGDIHSVVADAGVIVAAGTFGSPHLLQVSGIGDPDRLDEVGIEPVVENPEVGLNLQDHPIAGIMHDSLRRDTLDDAENLIELTRWLALRRGRLTSPVAEAGAFVRSSPDVPEPNLQFHFGPASFDDHGRTRHDGHAFTFGPMLLNPASRGSVMARSPDVTDHPVITTNCLTEPQDLEALVRGMEIGRELAAQRPFDDYRGHEIYPGRSVTTRDELVSFIRRRVELLYHPVGTCRMGKDDLAVVDPQLRVNGVDGLRVVDASVMPRIISGNTNAPTLMIADRASEMLLGA